MVITLSREVLFILHTLQTNGFEAYIVGGAVRDLLIHAHHGEDQPVVDFDFTTNATPEQIQALFPESYYENKFGTVGIAPKHIREMMGQATDTTIPTVEPESRDRVIDIARASKVHVSLAHQVPTEQEIKKTHEPDYEITTYRSDGVYNDHRRPETVTWGKTIEDDLSRRDFTINAMAIRVNPDVLSEKAHNNFPDPSLQLQPDHYEIIDLFNGLNDLQANLIRTVGEAHLRFQEDALRMLRAIRFSVQLNMKMSDETFAAITALAADIQHVSWERIGDEFMKMMRSPFPAEAIELLEETGLLHYLIPELREGKGVEQGGHHTTDVWTHSVDALRNTPSKDPVVRLATLLHDVAKPRTYHQADHTKPTFYNHEIIGARMAKDIAQRFRLARKDCDRVFTLVRQHMFYYQPTHTDAAVRRFMRNVGLENIDDILDLREGDRLGSGARKTSWRLEEMKQRMIEQLHQPFAITDLAIDGTDLMDEMGLKPGPTIGQILKHLFEIVLEEPELNTKEKLMELAQEYLAKN